MPCRWFALFLLTLVLGITSVALAEDAPPQGAKPLTEILRPIEQRPDFVYFEEIEFEKGKYKIEFHIKGGPKQKIEVDPVTGLPRQDAPTR